MNWQQMEGNWKQVKGRVRQHWGKLTDDDVDRIQGRRMELLGRLQERYGRNKEELEREVDSWVETLTEPSRHT